MAAGAFIFSRSGVAFADQTLFRLALESSWPWLVHPGFFLIDGLQVMRNIDSKGTSAMRATYVGSSIGSQRMVYSFELDRVGAIHAKLAFRVRFCAGFDFANGGKLHGLGPHSPASGGIRGDIGSWSARLVFTKGGGLGTYVYHQGQLGRFGDGVRAADFAFLPERWYRLEMEVFLNGKNRKNGTVTVFIDGVPRIRHEGLQFWSDGATNYTIDRFLFSTFYGGHSERFSPKDSEGRFINTYADFEDFIVTTK